MKSSRILLLVLFTAFAAGCGGGGSSSSAPPPAAPPAPTAANVMNVTVNGAFCSSGSYPNKGCVKVTICAPGSTTNCQVINDILLDTGSYGLRIFAQALTPSLAQALPQITTPGGALAECIHFADGKSTWGPVQQADIILGNDGIGGERTTQSVPIQIINAGYASVPASCGTPNQTPASTGYNGILGVGLLTQDCGSACAPPNASPPQWYFACSGTNCTATTATLAQQVQNPVPLLPTGFNNGVVIQLPAVPTGGAPYTNGLLFLGIGSQANNTPTGVTVFPASAAGEFITVFNGANDTSFIDSGSNGLFIGNPPPSLPACSGVNSSWFCPPATVALGATNEGTGGTPSVPLSFSIANANSLFSTSNSVFGELGDRRRPDSTGGSPSFTAGPW